MILLGAIQGLTEFLPVSSSGHLILFKEILGVEFASGLFLEVMLHLGTLIPVLIVFRQDIISLFKPPFKKMGYLIIASIPAAITGLLLEDKVDFLSATKYICFFFLLTAILLFVTEIVSKKVEEKKLQEFNIKTAIIMGLAQGIAIVPGLSRSGTTISSGVLSKGKREEVASFSFLMSIPVILGAVLLYLYKILFKESIVIASSDILPLFFGILSASVFGYVAIKLMLGVIKKSNYKWFSLYLVLVFILTFIDGYIYNF